MFDLTVLLTDLKVETFIIRHTGVGPVKWRDPKRTKVYIYIILLENK